MNMKIVLLFITLLFLSACRWAVVMAPEETQPTPIEQLDLVTTEAEPVQAERPTSTPLAVPTVTRVPDAEEPTPRVTAEPAPETETASEARFDRYLPLNQPGPGSLSLRGLVRVGDGWQWAAYAYPPAIDPFNSDYAPATDRLLIWQNAAGAGPGNLASGPLAIVDVTSGIQEEILPAGVVAAAWAPNGSDFAYILATPDTYELRWRTAGGADRLLAEDVPHSLRVSPDGNLVAFTRESHYGLSAEPGLYVVDIASGEETQVSPLDRAGYGGSGLFWKPQWSPDSSQLLLYTSQDNDRAAVAHEAGFVWGAADGSFNHLLPDSAFLAFFDQPPLDDQHYRCRGVPVLLADPLLVMPVGDCLLMSDEAPQEAQIAVFELDESRGEIALANVLSVPAGTTLLAWDVPGQSVVLDQDGRITSIPVLTPTAEEPPAPANCPQPGEGVYLLVDAARGYCFLYPAEYDVFVEGSGDLTFYQRSLLNTEAPLATVAVEASGSRTLSEVAQQRLDDFAFPGAQTQEAVLDGQPAVMLDNLPGQDTNRRLISVYEGLVYDLMVARIGEEYGAIGEEAQALYDLITSTWQYVAVEPDAPLIAGPECPFAGDGTFLLRDDANGYCVLLPEEYSVDQTTDEAGVAQASIYQGSPQDVTHARLFIGVEDAQGRTLQEVTDERVALVQEALPDREVLWSFGHMLDGVFGNQLEQVPGQDLSRQLLLVKDGRLYTLTFIPDDPTAGDAYTEMQALYELVVDTFSFLNP